MNIEDKEFMEKYILNNPFEFKQGIISHCREMDKIDVYNWVAEDELKIDKLQQENKHLDEVNCKLRRKIGQLEDNWNKLREYIRKNIIYDDVGMKILDPSPLEDYIQEIEQGSDSNGNN